MIEWRLDFMSKLLSGLRLCDVHFWQTAAAVSVGKAFEESVMARLPLFDWSCFCAVVHRG